MKTQNNQVLNFDVMTMTISFETVSIVIVAIFAI